MLEMTKKKKELKREKEKPEPKPQPVKEESSLEENSFDFGGMPPRDLKKNLGCG